MKKLLLLVLMIAVFAAVDRLGGKILEKFMANHGIAFTSAHFAPADFGLFTPDGIKKFSAGIASGTMITSRAITATGLLLAGMIFLGFFGVASLPNRIDMEIKPQKTGLEHGADDSQFTVDKTLVPLMVLLFAIFAATTGWKLSHTSPAMDHPGYTYGNRLRDMASFEYLAWRRILFPLLDAAPGPKCGLIRALSWNRAELGKLLNVERGELAVMARSAEQEGCYAEAKDILLTRYASGEMNEADRLNLLGFLDSREFYLDGVEVAKKELDTSGSVSAAYYAGLFAFKTGKHDLASKHFDMAIGKNPKFADAYYWRGQIRESAGDNVSALKDYTSACNILPSHAAAKTAIGRIASEERANEACLQSAGPEESKIDSRQTR